ncbi:phage holin family protein [Cronobacter malonaticus]|uniref:phage holin family protein n=2 Tax=Cronobacter TaxID=413496 RepID=UPI0024AFCDB5|nr:phage holin family protein [Cronobacter malonaticus]MDI7592587.1 phage holin family protein [Cronobacter malonaticus]
MLPDNPAFNVELSYRSGTISAGAALTGVSIYGLLTGTDYGVIFGAFAGAVFYVASAADLPLIRRAAYFFVSYIAGVYGSGLVGSKLASLTHYSEPLDALGAVILSALTIKILTFASQQDPAQWFQRWRGGANGNK